MRKALVSAFIVLGLATQVTQNMNVGYVGQSLARTPLAPLAGPIDQVRWGIETYGFYTGTNTYWRMFSPVHKYDWFWRVIATDPDGHDRPLAAPPARADDLSTLFFDFREAKMLLNLWTRPSMQAAYIDHRCREETAAGRRPSSIRLELHWRDIVPPEQAATSGTHRGSTGSSRVISEQACR